MQRVVQELTVGHVRSAQKLKAQNEQLALQEVELQYQLPINGRASKVISWDSVKFDFEWDFHTAPGQRDSDLELPQMTYGAYIPRGGPVGVFACVRDYKENEKTGAVNGATVAIGVIADGSTEFRGFLNVTFQGFAMSNDAFDDL